MRLITPLGVLIVEDSENDALLIIDELRNGGYDPEYQRVETREQMETALSRREWDVIIADYRLPDFDGLEALEIAQANCKSCPFIIVSGQIGEDVAVNAVKAGASDYVLKDNLTRLVPAVEREIREAKVRQEVRKAQEALQEERERSHSILESITDGFYALDKNWHFTYVNGAAEQIIGQDWRTLKGKTLWEVFPYASELTDHEDLRRAMTERTPVTIERFYERLQMWYIIRAYPYADGLAVYLRDITSQKRAEEDLRKSRELLQTVVDSVAAAIYLKDLDGRLLLVNREFERVIELPREEILGRTDYEFLPRETADAITANDRAVIQSQKTMQVEEVLPLSDGDHTYISVKVPARDPDGNIYGLCGVSADITDTKRMQEALDSERLRLRTVLDALPTGVMIADSGGSVIEANELATKIWGGSRHLTGISDYEQYRGRWADTGDPIAAEDWALARALTKGETVVGEIIDIERFDGTNGTILNSAAPIRDADGKIIGAVVAIQDITHQRELERQTAQQASTLAAILDTVPVGIIVADIQTRNITYYSKHTDVILGEQVTGNAGQPAPHSYQLLQADGTQFPADSLPLSRALRGETAANVEIRVKRQDGTEVTVISSSAPILDTDGRIMAAVASLDDISEILALRRDIETALDRERHFSLLLQRALLPEEPSIDHGYDVAVEYIPYYMGREIGGDFYDVFEVAGGKAGIVIGDVSGKGLEAASLAAATRSTIHALVHETGSAGEALARANSILCKRQTTFESQFVTVFLAVIDIETGEFNYASAGHPPAAMYREGSVRFLKPDFQPPVCVVPDAVYPQFDDHLKPGDAFVVYTDGVAEARKGLDMFDLEGIAQALEEYGHMEVEDIAGELIAAASNWAEGHLSDDAAVLVVKRHESVKLTDKDK